MIFHPLHCLARKVNTRSWAQPAPVSLEDGEEGRLQARCTGSSPFYRWGNQGSEGLSHLPKVTQLNARQSQYSNPDWLQAAAYGPFPAGCRPGCLNVCFISSCSQLLLRVAQKPPVLASRGEAYVFVNMQIPEPYPDPPSIISVGTLESAFVNAPQVGVRPCSWKRGNRCLPQSRPGLRPRKRRLFGKEQAVCPVLHTPLSPGLGECCPSCFKLVHRNSPASQRVSEQLSSCWGNNDSTQGEYG